MELCLNPYIQILWSLREFNFITIFAYCTSCVNITVNQLDQYYSIDCTSCVNITVNQLNQYYSIDWTSCVNITVNQLDQYYSIYCTSCVNITVNQLDQYYSIDCTSCVNILVNRRVNIKCFVMSTYITCIILWVDCLTIYTRPCLYIGTWISYNFAFIVHY